MSTNNSAGPKQPGPVARIVIGVAIGLLLLFILAKVLGPKREDPMVEFYKNLNRSMDGSVARPR